MWEHMAKTHNEMKHHKCSLCSFKTPSRSDLMHHKYAKHGVGRGPTAGHHQTPYHTEGNLTIGFSKLDTSNIVQGKKYFVSLKDTVSALCTYRMKQILRAPFELSTGVF